MLIKSENLTWIYVHVRNERTARARYALWWRKHLMYFFMVFAFIHFREPARTGTKKQILLVNINVEICAAPTSYELRKFMKSVGKT